MALKIKDFSIELQLCSKKFFVGLGFAGVSFFACRIVQASVTAIVFLVGMFLVLSITEIKCGPKLNRILNALWGISVPFTALFLTQLLMNAGFSQIENLQIVLGLFCTAIMPLLIFICTKNYRVSVLLGISLPMCLTIINYFVVNFRGNELSPADFLAIGTALNVAGQYDYTVDAPFVYACCLAVAYCFAGFCFDNEKQKLSLTNSLVAVVIEIGMVLGLMAGVSAVEPQHFFTNGSVINGCLLNFVCRFGSTEIECPEGYNTDIIRNIESRYVNQGGERLFSSGYAKHYCRYGRSIC